MAGERKVEWEDDPVYLPPGSVVLSAEDVEKVRGTEEQAQRSAYATTGEKEAYFTGRAHAFADVLSLLDRKERT